MDERNVQLFVRPLRDPAVASDDDADEVVYVTRGDGRVDVGGERHQLRAGTALFVPRGTRWSAEGNAVGVSVLVHDPEPADGHAVLDLTSSGKGSATAGREFVL